MYEPHLCVSVFVLLSLPASDRSTLFVHIRLSLFLLAQQITHSPFLHTFPLDYIPPYLSSLWISSTLTSTPLLESTNEQPMLRLEE